MQGPSRKSALRAAALLLLSSTLAGAAYAGPSAVTVAWNTLKTLGSVPTQSTPAKALDGKRVTIPGFMVPLEDDADNVSEFILVPYAGACIHVPPPPPNQMVHVLMNHGSKAPVSFTDPITVTGTLHISTVKSPYGNISYDLSAESVAPYTGGA